MWVSADRSTSIVPGRGVVQLCMCESGASFLCVNRDRILVRNWDKALQSFPPCYTQSPLLTDSPSPLGWNWFVMQTLYAGTSSLRTLKIMPRYFNEIVRSWIRLQDESTQTTDTLKWDIHRRPVIYAASIFFGHKIEKRDFHGAWSEGGSSILFTGRKGAPVNCSQAMIYIFHAFNNIHVYTHYTAQYTCALIRAPQINQAVTNN